MFPYSLLSTSKLVFRFSDKQMFLCQVRENWTDGNFSNETNYTAAVSAFQGIMETKMETTVMLGLCRGTGKENGNYFI